VIPAQIDVITSFQELFEKVKVRDMPKHSLFTVPLHLGPGFSIGVKAYFLSIKPFFLRMLTTRSVADMVWSRNRRRGHTSIS
jgi:hypothetical protein